MFFSPFASLINREKICANREKIGTQKATIFSPLVFHRFRPHDFCPDLSRSGPQEGQKRTNGDKTGHFGTNWETPPFSIYPHCWAI